jgi:hypothetical protein
MSAVIHHPANVGKPSIDHFWSNAFESSLSFSFSNDRGEIVHRTIETQKQQMTSLYKSSDSTHRIIDSCWKHPPTFATNTQVTSMATGAHSRLGREMGKYLAGL